MRPARDTCRRTRGCLLPALLLACGPALAATISVTGPGEGAACSLRSAILAANTNTAQGQCNAGDPSPADLIVLLPETHELTFGQLALSSDIVLLGADADRTRVVQSGSARVFDVSGAGTDAFLIGMTLVGGDVSGNASPNGGVVLVRDGARLDITDSTLRDGVAASGGGIYSIGAGRLSLQRVAIVDNRATGSGGGIRHGSGEIAPWINVTLSGNVAGGDGGGLSTSAGIDLRASTVTRNRSASGGGGLHYSGTPANGAMFAFNNTVVADNSDSLGTAANADLACPGTTVLGGRYNLVQRSNCIQTDSNGTALSGDPRLSPLWDFGDGVLTHAPLAGSVLIDAGAPQGSAVACPSTDARGVPRPAAACDVGAHEQVFDAVVNTTVDAVDANPGNGVCATAQNQCSLRAAAQEASASNGRWMVRLPAGTYTLSLAGTSGAGGDLDLRALSDPREALQFALFGAGPTQSVIRTSGNSRILRASNQTNSAMPGEEVDVALVGVTLRDGDTSALGGQGRGGAILVSDANLMLYDTVVRANRTGFASGAGIAALGSAADGSAAHLHVERSAIIDNTSGGQAGGLQVSQARGTLLNSTVSGNVGEAGSGVQTFGSHPDALLEIVHSTIAGNRARGAGAAGLYAASGAMPVPAVVLRASILAGNTTLTASMLPTPADCDTGVTGQSGIVSLGANRVEAVDAGDACELTGSPGTDLIGTPVLLNLRDDLASLPVHRLQPGSPALDAVPGAACVDARQRRIWRDQAGTARPSGPGCDAGAAEGAVAPPPDPVFADGFED